MMSSIHISTKVAGLIVTYNPNYELLSEVIESISKQVKRIVIVDNNSLNKAEIKKLISSHSLNDVTFVENSQNYGLAKAMNQGVERIGNGDIDWILFLDQDSVPSESYVTTLFTKIFSEYNGDLKKVLAIRSNETYTNSIMDKMFTASIKVVKSSIMSGSIVRRDVFQRIKFREYFCNDFIDTDFFFEIKRMGGLYLLYDAPLLRHRLGSPIKMFGKEVNYENPVRVYYMVRNSTILTLEGKGGIRLIIVGYSPLLLIVIRNGLKIALVTLLKALKDSILGKCVS